MSIKILHILHDEKFIDGAIDTFNSTSVINTYVSIEDTKPFNRIKSHASDVLIIGRDEILSFIVSGGFQLVAFHTLTRDKYELVLQIPMHIKILWLAWGYDLYQTYPTPILDVDLYKEYTNKYISSLIPKIPIHTQIKRLIKKVIFYSKYKKLQIEHENFLRKERDIIKKVFERLDYMSTILPSEYDALCEYPSFTAAYFPFQYVNREKLEPKWISADANKILLGNSATATNNHLDIIIKLSRENILNECIVPCSYGDFDYRDYLVRTVEDKSNIYLVRDYMPFADYIQMLRSCRAGIFGHIRQQAIGNVLFCMLQGSKIFLYKDSVAYKYFKKAGYIIFSIEDDLSNDSVNQLLTDEERNINATKILNQFAYKNVVERLDRFLKNINESLEI